MDAQTFLISQVCLYLGDELPQGAMGIFWHHHRAPFVDDYFFPSTEKGDQFRGGYNAASLMILPTVWQPRTITFFTPDVK